VPDIFDEVEEDLRADRTRRLMQRYGGLVLGAVLLVVAGVAGLQGWRWWQARQEAAAAAIYLDAHRAAEREGADLKAAGQSFATMAETAPAGYRTLALLRAAALKAETGETEAALAIWDRVAGDASADPLYRELAGVLWVLHGLDRTDPAQLAARIAPLAQEGAPWRASAREAQALVELKRGENDAARRTLQALAADPATPQGIRERAMRLASGISG
jgi:hypothetical protein